MTQSYLARKKLFRIPEFCLDNIERDSTIEERARLLDSRARVLGLGVVAGWSASLPDRYTNLNVIVYMR